VCEVDFSFAMSVTRVHEDPRVTKPYADEQWTTILDLGRKIDRDLAEHGRAVDAGRRADIRLVDDMEGPEWTFTALSPKKKELGAALLRRLATRFAPGGFLHSGQGKWYPGEPLPRWALGIWWRSDGKRCGAIPN
jgi:uncharacterized protein (DUF2126 family)